MKESKTSCIALIGYIQTSIEILMKLKNDQDSKNVVICDRCKNDVKQKIKDKNRKNDPKKQKAVDDKELRDL